MIQEAHLPVNSLAKARALVHRLLPAYCLFAGRPQKAPGIQKRIQVVTLVHVYMAARASLLDVRTQLTEVALEAPDALLQAHFIRMSDPRSDTTILLGNVYQFQASRPEQQAAMLELARLVIARWSAHSDLIVIGGDFNASLTPRTGYVGSDITRNADSRLQEWCTQTALSCAAPAQATWHSYNESRSAVLDCFFWRSKTDQLDIVGAEAFPSPDPRMDHHGVQICLLGAGIGLMPPLEALKKPTRLNMRCWSKKKRNWHNEVNRILDQGMQDQDEFRELDHAKHIALDCARSVLGTTGGKIGRLIPHHSVAVKRLKARLTLLKVARREIHSRKALGNNMESPTRAMRRVWDAGLYPEPAQFQMLSSLGSPQNVVWTEKWLRMLRSQSAMILEEWQQLRRTELTEAAERDRQGAIDRFYTGGELRRLLHPRAPAPHSPLLQTTLPDTLRVIGDCRELEALRAEVSVLRDTEIHLIANDTLCITGIRPEDLYRVLFLVESRKLMARLMPGQVRLVSSAGDRLCAWEHELATEGTATKGFCTRCESRDLLQLTAVRAESGRTMVTWCHDCAKFTDSRVRAADYEILFWNTDGIPRVSPDSRESLRETISMEDFEFLLRQLPNNRAPGPDGLPYELIKEAPNSLKSIILNCINKILTGTAVPPQSWLGGLVRFLLKKDEVTVISGYRPVCLLDTVYKLLSAVITDRLYRLAERHGLLDPSQEGFRRLHSPQRQVQSLHWAFQEAAGRKEKLFCCYLDFANAFNSIDHKALWRWLRELNIPDIDLLQSLYSGAGYQADLPYGRSASVFLSRGKKQGDKLSPLLFSLVFNALLLALKAAGVGHRIITGLRTPARGFADDLTILTGSETDMSHLLRVVNKFCAWSGMRVKREKSVISGFDYNTGRSIPTEGIMFDGASLSSLAATDSFPYLGVRASLIGRHNRRPAPCLDDEIKHVFSTTRNSIRLVKHHKFLLSQMVPAMHMVTTAWFRYSAPLVPWTDADLDKLYSVWLQVQRAAWKLSPGFPSAPLMFPEEHGGCPATHPVVPMIQALATHIEQLVALPDELRDTTIRKFKQLCDSCGCRNEHELADHLAEERRPRACPMARLLRACGKLKMEIRLPACLSLGVAGRDTSWRGLLTHMKSKCTSSDADQQLKTEFELVQRSWGTIRRRFRRRGIRAPRQLIVNPRVSPAIWLVPERMSKNPPWLEPLRRILQMVDTRNLFRRLDRGEGTPAEATHQALIHDVIRGLQRHDVPVEPLFSDSRWNLVRSSAPSRSWLNVLNRNGFPCRVDGYTDQTDPVVSLTEIGQYADAERANLLALTLWLAPTLRTRRDQDIAMADRGPISWASVRLSMDRIEFNDDCLQSDVQCHGAFEITNRDGLSRIEREGQLVSIVNQGRLGLLTDECAPRGIDLEYVYDSIQAWVAYVELHEKGRGFGSHQFWHGLKTALNLDSIVGCCPLVAPSSFSHSSWDGESCDWGYQLLPNRRMFDLLCTPLGEQRRFCKLMSADKLWFALTRRTTLGRDVRRALESTGQIVTVFKKGSRVAACKGCFRTAKLKAIQNKEDWCLWASNLAVREQTASGEIKAKADSIHLSADGVVPLDLTCPSSREAMLGPARTAYAHNGIIVATDGSLKKNGAMGAAFVAKDDRLKERSVAVLGPPSSIRPELTGIALALEECPKEVELTILTDCLSAMRLLQSTQRRDFPLWLHRHTVRHLLKHVVNLLNARSASGSVTRFIKVRAHRGEPLNEAADALAAAAAESDPSRGLALDLDEDAIYFSFRGMWFEYDSRIREELIQRAAKLCVTRTLRSKCRRASQEGSTPALPLTTTWMLRQGHGRDLLGKVLGEMRISTAKKQVLQSIAGSFPCNAVLHKWKLVQSAACVLCGHPAETQSHIQCSCPALKEARIRAHHNLAQMLWKGISVATKQWVVAVEHTVSGLLGLAQPEEHIDVWQRAWDEITDLDLEGGEDSELAVAEAEFKRKRPDAWAVNWDKRCVFILEFTRPNDRCADSLTSTDAQKTARYTPLRDRLARLLQGWEVEIQTYTMGIRGSHDSDRWKANLNRLGVTGTRAVRLLHDLVSQTLVELTDLYKVRYAALQQHPVSHVERGI